MFHSYPYTDFHEMNLDWFLNKFKALTNDVSRLQSIIENLDISENDNINIRGESFYAPFAQILPTAQRVFNSGLYGQGMCIGKHNSRPVMMQCFTDNTSAGSNNIIVFYYMDTGELINRFNIASGHCNSCAYSENTDTYFIACAGGGSLDYRVIEIDINGNLKASYEMQEGPWAITCYKDKLFILAGNNLIITNLYLSEQKRYAMTYSAGLTYQGMFCDANYLYLPCGNTAYYGTDRNVNYYEVRNHEGASLGFIRNLIPFETEEGDFLDDTLYVSCPYQDMSAILISDLYNDNFTGYLSSDTLDSDVSIEQTIYIDETYNGYFMDGTQAKPYSTLLRYTAYVKNNVSRLTLQLLSDSEHILFMQKEVPYQVIINGNDHKILRVNWQGGIYFAMSNITIVGTTGATSLLIDCTRCVLNNITFGETDSAIVPLRLIDMHSAYEITNITFNQDASNACLYLMGDGYIRVWHVNVATWKGNMFGGVLDVDSSFPYDLFAQSDLYGITYKIQFYLNASGMDVSKLYIPLSIDVANANLTFVNAPEGFENDISAINVETFASGSRKKALVTMIKTDGTMTQFYNT